MRYTTASEENSLAVTQAAEAMGCRVTRHAGRGQWHQLVIAGNGNRWHPAGAGAWLRRHGIFGQRSHEKRLPDAVFRLPNAQVATLLRHLWATDGSVTLRRAGSRGAARVYFSTCSAGLAGDVAALLLRLGIVARQRVVRSGGTRAVHTVDVSGAAMQQRFIETRGWIRPARRRRRGAASILAERRRHDQCRYLAEGSHAGRAASDAPARRHDPGHGVDARHGVWRQRALPLRAQPGGG
ncbi:MAG: LAGLIDADG family homing endonuclease [Steroidobacteraceae bacterium]